MSTMRNSVKLIGRPGADPQTRTFENNRSVTHFSLAVNESYQNAKKEWTANTQWFNIIAWDDVAKRVSKLVRKGLRVAITGKLRTRDWTDSKGRHDITEIQIEDFYPLDWEDSAAKS